MNLIQIIELIWSSPNSWSEAVQNAVTEATKIIKGIKSVHFKRCTIKMKDKKLIEYEVNMKIAFNVER